MKTETKNAMQVFEYLTGVRPSSAHIGRGSMKEYVQLYVPMDDERVRFLKENFYTHGHVHGVYPFRALGKLEIDYLHSTFPDTQGRMWLAVDVKAAKLIKTK